MGRRKKETPQHHRESIATAAQNLFAQKGMDATSMDEIAKAAGYSKATLYVYFENKDHIVAFLILESIKKLQGYLQDALMEHQESAKRYRSLCFALLRYQEEYPEYFNMALQNINLPMEGKQDQSEEWETFQIGESINATLSQFLLDGIQAQAFREDLPILPTIFSFWGMLSGFINLATSKEAYINQSMRLTKTAFLEYGFAMLYRSIIKEENL